MTPGAAPLLMTPGPTRIPPRVLAAGSLVLHHRTAEFSRALGELIERLHPLFGTATADVLPVHATGRAAMEGAIVNLFNPGDTIVAVCNGKFGEMWAGFAERYGVGVVRVCTDWERSASAAEVAHALDENPGARAVTVAHSDTSTGVLNPVAEIARAARARDALVMVDVISSLGGAPVHFDAWDLDVAVTSSQKCLMASAGISFVVMSERAWRAAETGTMPRVYLDFGAIHRALTGARPETPGTTPVMLVLQVLESLRMLDEEGYEAVFTRHRRMAERLRSWALARGLGLLGAGIVERSPTLTALAVAEGVDPAVLRQRVRQRGIEIAVGLGAYRPTCVRVGHMGDIRMADVERTIGALDEALAGDGSPRPVDARR